MSLEVKDPYRYFLHIIVTELQNNAEIKIYGRTYSADKDDIPVKSLIQEILDEVGGDASEITRTLTLSDEIAADGNITESKRNVVNELEFFFIQKNPDECVVTKNDCYLNKEGQIGMVYPDFSDQIYKSIIDCFNKYDFIELYNFLYLENQGLYTHNGLFPDIFKKLHTDQLVEKYDSFDKLEERFKMFKEKYKSIKAEERKNNNKYKNLKIDERIHEDTIEYILPEYKTGIKNYLVAP